MAAIIVNNDVLFLHVPRTGGSFITKLLRKRWGVTQLSSRNMPEYYGHALIGHFGDLQRYRFTFAFVRHPVSWVESIWKFIQSRKYPWRPFKKSLHGRWHPWDILLSYEADEFLDWIHNIIRNEPGLFTRMTEWFVGPPDSRLIDFIGRYDTLHADICTALTLARLPDPPSLADVQAMEPVSPRPGVVEWQIDSLNAFKQSERVLIKRFWPEDYNNG